MNVITEGTNGESLLDEFLDDVGDGHHLLGFTGHISHPDTMLRFVHQLSDRSIHCGMRAHFYTFLFFFRKRKKK